MQIYKLTNIFESTFPSWQKQQKNTNAFDWPDPYALHLFNKYALSICYVPVPVLDIQDIEINKTEKQK